MCLTPVICLQVHKTWLEVIDVPPSSAEKDWEMQVMRLQLQAAPEVAQAWSTP
jgi:hypothetical protein